MALFSKKPPCPICGGKISWFLPSKIEGEYICDNCFGKIDMESRKSNSLTMQQFREYLTFYDQNQLLKNKFVISEQVDFGILDTKFIFDFQNRLFCMSKRPDKTVFEGIHLKSFIVKEDNIPLVEGSAAGIRRHGSTVPERAMALAPQIDRFIASRQRARTLDRMDDGKINNSVPGQYFNATEPLQKFNVELRLDHPYWTVIQCDMDGPGFDGDRPDINDYLRDYQHKSEEIEKLVSSFRAVAFPDAPEQTVGFNTTGTQAVYTTAAQPADAIEEIKKYKVLMEEGVITQQEFDAKKKQLLGI